MQRIEHTEENWIFPFVEYRPAEAKGKLPLIIQLHGAGERGNSPEELHLVDANGFSAMLQDGEFPCLVMMPQCRWDTFWAAKVESLLQFIEQIKTHFDVDEDRVYLTGMSMGGFGTWYTAMAAPELFAAIAPVCGGGMAWNAGVLKMPVWVFHGAVDPDVNVRNSDEMVEGLKKHGANVRYTRLDGVGHNVWEHTYNEELLNWLLSWQRGQKA